MGHHPYVAYGGNGAGITGGVRREGFHQLSTVSAKGKRTLALMAIGTFPPASWPCRISARASVYPVYYWHAEPATVIVPRQAIHKATDQLLRSHMVPNVGSQGAQDDDIAHYIHGVIKQRQPAAYTTICNSSGGAGRPPATRPCCNAIDKPYIARTNIRRSRSLARQEYHPRRPMLQVHVISKVFPAATRN